jgi:phage-related protein
MLVRCAGPRRVYYRDKQGVEPVDDFIDALPAKRAAKIDDYIQEYLNDRPAVAPPPDFPITSQIEGELRELRVRFGNTRYRILYQRSDNLIVLLHAFGLRFGFRRQGGGDTDARLQGPHGRQQACATPRGGRRRAWP